MEASNYRVIPFTGDDERGYKWSVVSEHPEGTLEVWRGATAAQAEEWARREAAYVASCSAEPLWTDDASYAAWQARA